ncbi:MAG: dephospho-CoA kinase [Microbacteriaceae bacterium]
MYLIALTGGIASGKSVVASRLAQLGAVHIDADRLARDVVQPGTPALAKIVAEFGDEVIADDGSLNRQALGAIVFPDASKREILNGITHPAVWAKVVELCSAAQEANPDAVIVYDVPLLVEASPERPITFDLVVVVHAPSSLRLERLMKLRGMTRQEASHRLNSQASDAERLAIADVVIENTGSIETMLQQVDSLWDTVSARAHKV